MLVANIGHKFRTRERSSWLKNVAVMKWIGSEVITRLISDNTNRNIVIGKYKGREESVYKLSDTRNGLFAFVIQGAFEVQYRLLHARDGLALWEADEIELEALSNDAIILLMEMPLLNDES